MFLHVTSTCAPASTAAVPRDDLQLQVASDAEAAPRLHQHDHQVESVGLLAQNVPAAAARARRHEEDHHGAVSRQRTLLLSDLAHPHHGVHSVAAAVRGVTGLAQVEAGAGGAAPVAVQPAEQSGRSVEVVLLHGRHEQSHSAAQETPHVENTDQVSSLHCDAGAVFASH